MSEDIAINDKELSAVIHRFAAYRDKSVPEIVRAQGRLVAVNLAFATQPYGNDDAARFKGQNAVRSDLARVFIGPARVLEIANAGGANALSTWLKTALAAGDAEGVEAAWTRLSGRPIEVGADVIPQWHSAQRNARGRVNRRARPMIVLKQGSIDAYTREKEKLVGFGKSAFATAARQLGGTRGIAGWVSRNKGPGGANDLTRGRGNTNPRVVIYSDVNYADKILTEAAQRDAIRMQAEKMAAAMVKQISAEAARAA